MTNPDDASQAKTHHDDQGRVSDAVAANWVDQYCPKWSRPYLRLSRADRPVGTWLLLLPCWWGLMLALWSSGTLPTRYDAWLFVAFAVGAFLMRGAGCTWNDISDRDIDAKVARTKSRPLPSGQVTTRGAVIWMVVQAALGGCILLTLNTFSIILGIASILPVLIYPFAKRFTWWPQMFLGIAINWGVLIGWAAHTGSLTWAPVVLYLAGISWTLYYDTIYACQDKQDDARIGVKSTARLFKDNVRSWLHNFMYLTLGLLTFALIVAFQPDLHPISTLVAMGCLWLFGWHLAWQMRQLDEDDPQSCLRVFRSNRDAGLLIVSGLALAIIAHHAAGAA